MQQPDVHAPELTGPVLCARTHRVGMSEVDGAGLIYFAAPMPWAERLFSDWLAELGHTTRALFESGAAYPVVETVHVDGICDTVTAPAAVDPRVRAAAAEVARATLAVLDGAGVFAIELFVVGDDVLVNEIAPRVHNSGHLTIEACATSQFEQHVRAVGGLPLGATDLRVPAATMVNLLGTSDEPLRRDGLAGALALPETHVHLYGKDPRPARKIGHITALGTDAEETTSRALRARKELGL